MEDQHLLVLLLFLEPLQSLLSFLVLALELIPSLLELIVRHRLFLIRGLALGRLDDDLVLV